MGTKGKEMSIWDQMVLATKKSKLKSQPKPIPRSTGESSEKQEKESYWQYDLEKDGFKPKTDASNVSLKKRCFSWALFAFRVVFVILALVRLLNYHLSDNKSISISDNDNIQDSFEITIAELPTENLVHTDQLLTYSFGNSWGHPARVPYTPYTGSPYNKVMLELFTNVSGRQYDRLGHIFIDNITVWRTSTVEPYDNKTIISRSSKDITDYISLFQKGDPLELTFQLDNIVTKLQDGIFNVDLRIHYFDSPTPHHGRDETAKDFFYHYATTPPNRVIPLVVDPKKKTPLLYYPIASQSNPRWTRPLEDFGANLDGTLEHARLEVFLSGNAAEEFWYGNVLDEYVSKFKNSFHEISGHGPVRVLKVYLYDGKNEYLVATMVPTPVIFTGGFSPALWRPCVGIDAFDLEHLSIDLTPFLSLLKDEKPWELQFEIVSSLNDKYKDTIGENWILSGNIKQWTNQESKMDYGEMIQNTFNSTFDVNVIDIDDPNELHQTVNATARNEVASVVYLDDKPYVISRIYHNEFISSLKFVEDGDDEHHVVDLEKYNIISIYEEEAFRKSNPIVSLIDKSSWHFVGNVKTLDIDVPKSEMTYSAAISRSVDRFKYIKDYTSGQELEVKNSQDLVDYANTHDSIPHIIVNALKGSQTGSSKYTLAPSGNYGSGDSVHHVRVFKDYPFKEHYNRDVVVSKNSVVFDVIKRDL
ncbi:PNGaseA super family [Kluyveromyces marxianus]|nr:PNGaseA super family [Kluyveromyces marxianus]